MQYHGFQLFFDVLYFFLGRRSYGQKGKQNNFSNEIRSADDEFELHIFTALSEVILKGLTVAITGILAVVTITG